MIKLPEERKKHVSFVSITLLPAKGEIARRIIAENTKTHRRNCYFARRAVWIQLTTLHQISDNTSGGATDELNSNLATRKVFLDIANTFDRVWH